MYELFSVGWGQPDLRDQWKQGSQQVRAQLLAQANSTPYQPDPTRAHSPDALRQTFDAAVAAVTRACGGTAEVVAFPGE